MGKKKSVVKVKRDWSLAEKLAIVAESYEEGAVGVEVAEMPLRKTGLPRAGRADQQQKAKFRDGQGVYGHFIGQFCAEI